MTIQTNATEKNLMNEEIATLIDDSMIVGKNATWHRWGKKTVAKAAKLAIEAVAGVKAVKAVAEVKAVAGVKAVPEVKDEKGKVTTKAVVAVKAVKAVALVEAVSAIKEVKASPAIPAKPASIEMFIKCESAEICSQLIARMKAEGINCTTGVAPIADKGQKFCAGFEASDPKIIRAAFKEVKAQSGKYNVKGVAAAKAEKDAKAEEAKAAKAKAKAEKDAKAKAEKDAEAKKEAAKKEEAKADPKK